MAGLSLFNKRKFNAKPRMWESATLSDFGGGLNVVDNDLTMKSRYAKVSDNMNKNVDGSLSVRWGTKFKYDVAGIVTGTIIESVYFNRHTIIFTSTGQIAKITEAGVITPIWNTAIAAALPGAPTAWPTGLVVGDIDTSEFKGELICVNGRDKPVIISKTLTTKYLQDPASGSNVRVPIGKYVTTVSNYLIISGIAANTTEVYISSQGTAGVWPGDAAPNDSLTINLGAWVPQNTGDIIGIGSFRNYLVGFFNGAIVVVELGLYEGTVHKPKVQDNIVENGVISHRTVIGTKNDLVMADVLGFHTAIRTQFGLIDTRKLSDLVDPAFMKQVPSDANRKRAFSVHNRMENRFMTFMPLDTGPVAVWTMSSADKEQIKNPAFNTYSGWTFVCGCTSERGRVFLCEGTKIYQYGNAVFTDENYTADKIGDGIPVPIAFDFELPWSDLNERARKKALKAIQADTKGKAQFTLEIYVDNFRKDFLTQENDPAVALEFVAGDSLGYGGGDQPYGGGRRLRDERHWGMPADFKLFKIRIFGSTVEAFQLVTLTILYYMGTFRR